jgi:hypothetical protein
VAAHLLPPLSSVQVVALAAPPPGIYTQNGLPCLTLHEWFFLLHRLLITHLPSAFPVAMPQLLHFSCPLT